MPEHCKSLSLSRREFARGAASVAVLLAGAGRSRALWAAELAAPVTPDQALLRLRQGNEAFVSGRALASDKDGKRRHEVAQGQAPFAAILSCSDSRVPPEILFHQGLGDLFVVRNAGNTIDTTALGSLEFAVAELKAPLVVVLGHSKCGAVGGAIAVVDQGTVLPGSIGRMVEPIVPAVLDARRTNPADLMDAAIRANVSRTVKFLREASEPIMLDAVKSGRVKVVGAHYDLDSGKVDFFDLG
jgi:carbonic anhydrase